ncbi:MAG: hypothetical protein WD648_11520 [Planctomycetaceae bacterium]
MGGTVLVRYGAIPVVARCTADRADGLARGLRVVVGTSRGLELGTVLESVNGPETHNVEPQEHSHLSDNGERAESQFSVLRAASADDEARSLELKTNCEGQFSDWCRRIEGWNLDLELIDLEWTLDRSRLILYVLNERGPDCTKLALQAAAAGLGPVEVQPVDAEGLMQAQVSGGCGTGGGGCGCGS